MSLEWRLWSQSRFSFSLCVLTTRLSLLAASSLAFWIASALSSSTTRRFCRSTSRSSKMEILSDWNCDNSKVSRRTCSDRLWLSCYSALACCSSAIACSSVRLWWLARLSWDRVAFSAESSDILHLWSNSFLSISKWFTRLRRRLTSSFSIISSFWIERSNPVLIVPPCRNLRSSSSTFSRSWCSYVSKSDFSELSLSTSTRIIFRRFTNWTFSLSIIATSFVPLLSPVFSISLN